MSRSAAVLPYLTVPVGVVELGTSGWRVLSEGREPLWLRDGDPFPDWDARLDFTLDRDIEVRDHIGGHLDLDVSNDAFEVVTICRTGGGLRRWVTDRHVLPKEVPARMVLSVRPDSRMLAADLTVEVALQLSSALQSNNPLSPRHEGDKLWHVSSRFRLEGGTARLPMYDVPFSKVFPGVEWDHAPIHVALLNDPAGDIESSLAVYINTERTDFVRDAALHLPSAEALIWSSVVRRLVFSVLLDDSLDLPEELGPETLGGTARRWISQAFRGEEIAALRRRTRDDYSSMETTLDSWLARLMAPLGGGK